MFNKTIRKSVNSLNCVFCYKPIYYFHWGDWLYSSEVLLLIITLVVCYRLIEMRQDPTLERKSHTQKVISLLRWEVYSQA